MSHAADGDTGATVLDGVPAGGGQHCETTAIGALLHHAGLELSEPMLFGLGAGLSFVYWDSARQEVPFLGGRVKPFTLTRNLTERLGLTLTVRETTSPTKAWDQVRASIDAGTPVGLQLDCHDLEYFGTRVHFAGHVVALYGYDATRAYLLDTAQQGGRVHTSLQSLAAARAARGPMSARHRSFTVDAPAAAMAAPHVTAAIVPAITACAGEFLAPPIANIGNRGIATAATRVRSWFERVADPARDLPQIAAMMERAGTGGALFRNLYRDFLTESLDALGSSRHADAIGKGRDLFAESALLWTQVAELVELAGTAGDPAPLTDASDVLRRIATLETDAMTALAAA